MQFSELDNYHRDQYMALADVATMLGFTNLIEELTSLDTLGFQLPFILEGKSKRLYQDMQDQAKHSKGERGGLDSREAALLLQSFVSTAQSRKTQLPEHDVIARAIQQDPQRVFGCGHQ